MSFQSTVQQARAEGRTLLNEVEAKAALADAGVTVTNTRLATTADEAVALANDAGYPVALKIVSRDIAHKSDIGGVRLNLDDHAAVREAFAAITTAAAAAQPGSRVDGVSVQPMATAGVEVIVGMTRDPQYGPVLMFGLGGVMVEVFRDVSFRLAPLEERDADDMLSEIKGRAVLDGVRGAAPVDLGALRSALMSVSQFVQEHPEVSELDLNPIIASSSGAVAVDARIVLSEA